MNNYCYITDMTDDELKEIISDLSVKEAHIRQLMDYDLLLEELLRRKNNTKQISKAQILKALNECDLEGSSDKHYLIDADTFLEKLGFGEKVRED